MATKLDKTLKREIDIDGQAFMVAISPEGVKLTQKGFRKGREMSWKEMWGSGADEEGGGGMGGGMGGGSTGGGSTGGGGMGGGSMGGGSMGGGGMGA